MYNDDRSAHPYRSRKYRDRSNFGADGGYEEDGAQDDAREPRPGERRRVGAEPSEAFPSGRSGRGIYDNGRGDSGPRAEDASDFPDEAYAEASPRGRRSARGAIEAYPPDDLLEYDEFGRRRRRAGAGPAVGAKARRKGHEVAGWVLSVAVAVAAAFLVRSFVFEIILVDGESMFPTLYSHERVAIEKVSRYAGMPERGDIIIVKYPNMAGTYVKRAIGLPGETVEVKDSAVYIDGQPLAEDYVNPEPYQDMDPVTVPEDHVFVMGDNRAHSLDSRTAYIGPIRHDAILGHGLFVIWPFSNVHKIS